ncbi:MAG: hypothetical protein KC912_18865 [Proteobacteria bacterium]|nr:hypothetical protein [Pseudomonadota bacterium]
MRWLALGLLVGCTADVVEDTADSEPVTVDPWAGAMPVNAWILASGRVQCVVPMPHLREGDRLFGETLEPCIAEYATFEGTVDGEVVTGVLNTGNTDFPVEGTLTDGNLHYSVWLDLIIEVTATGRW